MIFIRHSQVSQVSFGLKTSSFPRRRESSHKSVRVADSINRLDAGFHQHDEVWHDIKDIVILAKARIQSNKESTSWTHHFLLDSRFRGNDVG